MSTKLSKFVNENIVLLMGIPLIVGIHYGWYKLQSNPVLIKPEERREMPIVKAFKRFINYDQEETKSVDVKK